MVGYFEIVVDVWWFVYVIFVVEVWWYEFFVRSVGLGLSKVRMRVWVWRWNMILLRVVRVWMIGVMCFLCMVFGICSFFCFSCFNVVFFLKFWNEFLNDFDF